MGEDQAVSVRIIHLLFSRFMPPDDPLGRHGPKLDQFLTFAHTPLNAQLCPYAKKCTYGNKCK